MSVLVGYLPGSAGSSSLNLGAALADSLAEPLSVVTVAPRPWPVPSMAKVDAEYAQWAREFVEAAGRSAREHLGSEWAGRTQLLDVADSSASRGLVGAAERVGASVLVVGSGDGQVGQVVAGSTTSRLLHSSPVPLAVAPRGYRRPPAGLQRLTCAFSGSADARTVVRSAAALAERLHVPLRVVTLAVRRHTMYPPEVGLGAEDEVLAALVEQAQAGLDDLVTQQLVDPGTVRQIGSGAGWREAIDDVDWAEGDLLAVGSSAGSPVARVFLGSHAEKVLRHSPVPVLVLPR